MNNFVKAAISPNGGSSMPPRSTINFSDRQLTYSVEKLEDLTVPLGRRICLRPAFTRFY